MKDRREFLEFLCKSVGILATVLWVDGCVIGPPYQEPYEFNEGFGEEEEPFFFGEEEEEEEFFGEEEEEEEEQGEEEEEEEEEGH